MFQNLFTFAALLDGAASVLLMNYPNCFIVE
jgi:hypothetical protein